jgi:hypothetical protein
MLVIVEECQNRGCERDVDMTREDDDGNPYRDGPAEPRFCSDDCADAASEAAYERSMEHYYGGASPVTVDEMMRAALAQKEGRS